MKSENLNIIKISLISLPIASVVLLPIYIYLNGIIWQDIAILVTGWIVAGMGITVGYHRLFAHRSFKTYSAIEWILMVMGSMALQNTIVKWCSDHRRHHKKLDTEEDPYSITKGFFHAHIGWILDGKDSPVLGVDDLKKKSSVRFQTKYYWSISLFLSFVLPALIGLAYGRPFGGLLWGGIVRVTLVHHFTFLINSLCHFIGDKSYDTEISARDSWFAALMTFGEGYHNYHHTFQWDYRNGVKWWHFDPTKWMIRSCSLIGLTKNLKRCTTAQIEKAKLEKQYRLAKEHCELLNIPEKWRTRLSQEYEQFLDTLQLWSEHHQAWYATKGRKIQKTIDQWDHRQLHDKYKEIQYALKAQKRRWQKMLRNLGETTAYPT